jgi:hypothetical protein
MLASVNALHAVDTFRMTEFLPRKIKNRHAGRTYQHTVATAAFFTFERLPAQADKAEPVHQSHNRTVWTKISAEASGHVDCENQYYHHYRKLHPKEWCQIGKPIQNV